jgi:hypothetical protein
MKKTAETPEIAERLVKQTTEKHGKSSPRDSMLCLNFKV